MTLPSSSSMGYFPNNTLANYNTKLPQRIELTGEWEVGLSEIQFPISWYNLSNDESHLFVSSWTARDHETEHHWIDISPPGGHYDAPEMLIAQINYRLRDMSIPINFSFNSISRKVQITYDETKTYAKFKMSIAMAELLGFEWSDDGEYTYPDDDSKEHIILKPRDGKYVCTRVCDLYRGFYSLYVYCDICEPIIVGNLKVQLLRTVNLNRQSEQMMVSRIYQNVQYVPILRKSFETIEIDIRDDAGKAVSFERGKVIVTLHFKKL
jgi:hypothetical protein